MAALAARARVSVPTPAERTRPRGRLASEQPSSRARLGPAPDASGSLLGVRAPLRPRAPWVSLRPRGRPGSGCGTKSGEPGCVEPAVPRAWGREARAAPREARGRDRGEPRGRPGGVSGAALPRPDPALSPQPGRGGAGEKRARPRGAALLPLRVLPARGRRRDGGCGRGELRAQHGGVPGPGVLRHRPGQGCGRRAGAQVRGRSVRVASLTQGCPCPCPLLPSCHPAMKGFFVYLEMSQGA